MPFYVVEYRYVDELKNLVEDFRPAHRTYLRQLEGEGKLVASGFLTDNAAFNGAMLILKAESAREVLDMGEKDPFYTNGLIDDIRIRQWVPTLGSHAKAFDTEFPSS